MDIKTVALAAVLGALGGFGASQFVAHAQFARIQHRLDQSPPIVVVDFVKMASAYPAGAPADEVERLMVETNGSILKLVGAGYLVLDAGAVVGAPSDVYLPVTEGVQP